MKSTEQTIGKYIAEAKRVPEAPEDSPAIRGLTQGLGSGRKLLFRLRWAVMSPEQRYAHLWSRTKKSSGYIRAARLSRN